MKEPSIKKNFIYSMFYQVFTLLMPFITAPYVSRVLGPEEIGIQSYTASYQVYFSLLAALGTSEYGAREISRVRNDRYLRSRIFWEITLLNVLTSAASILAWGVFIGFAAKYRIYYIVLTINLLAVMADISWLFRGLEEFQTVMVRNAACKTGGIICIFVFVKSRDNLLCYIVINALTVLASSLSMWPCLKKYIVKVSRGDLKIRRHLKETLIYFIPTVATSVYAVLDKTLIGLMTQDDAQNGYYQQADKIIGMAKGITFTAINSVTGVRISYLFAEKRLDEIHQRIAYTLHYIFFIGTGCTLGIMGIAPEFVPVFFGPGYSSVVSLLYILSPVIVIIGISNCISSHYYTPSGRRVQSTRFLIAGAGVNLLLNLLLIPDYHSCGAAVASICAELLITVLYVRYSNSFVTVRLLFQCGGKNLLAGIVMYGAVRLAAGAEMNAFLRLFWQAGTGCAVYILVLLLLKEEWIMGIISEWFYKISGGVEKWKKRNRK